MTFARHVDLFDIGLHKISLGALILVARPARRRRDHRGRDDGDQAGAGLRPLPRGELRLHEHRVSDADRHAGDGRGLPADRDSRRAGTGEYTRSIFQVSAIALIASWVVAVVVIPYLGYKMLPDPMRVRRPSLRSRLWRGSRPAGAGRAAARRTSTTTSTRRRSTGASARWSTWCVAHRVDRDRRHARASSSARSARFRFVPQQFFPASSRPELLVDLRLPEGSSFAATLARGAEARGDARRASRASRATSPTSAPAARASTCRSTSSCSSRTSRSSSSWRRATTSASECARGSLAALRRRFPGAARPRVAARERAAGRLSGAVPRVRRGHRDRARASRSRSADVDARRPGHVATCSSTGTSRPRSIRARRSTRTRRACSASRRRTWRRSSTTRCPGYPVDVRSASATSRSRCCCAARPTERAQLTLPQGPRDARRATARRCRSRRSPTSSYEPRGRHHLAARPAADDHRARRRASAMRRGRTSRKRIDPQLDALRATLPLGYRIEIGGAVEDSAQGPEIDRRRRAADAARRADAADDPAAELLAHADGGADGAARPDRRRRRAAACSASRSASSRCWARSRCPASSCATR